MQGHRREPRPVPSRVAFLILLAISIFFIILFCVEILTISISEVAQMFFQKEGWAIKNICDFPPWTIYGAFVEILSGRTYQNDFGNVTHIILKWFLSQKSLINVEYFMIGINHQFVMTFSQFTHQSKYHMLVLGGILDQILDQSINEFHEQCEASIDDCLAKEPIDLRTKLDVVLI